jgi:anthranilate synthase component 1
VQRDRFRELASTHRLVVLEATTHCDFHTPVSLFARMGNGAGTFLLESAPAGEALGRYSFFGRDPLATVCGRDGVYRLAGVFGDGTFDHPLAAMRALRERMNPAPGEGLLGGGMIGYLGYDAVRRFERLPELARDDRGLPDLYMVVPRLLYRYDHLRHALTAMVLQPVGADPDSAYEEGMARLDEALAVVRRPLPPPWTGGARPVSVLEDLPGEAAFAEAVRQAKEAIAAGECFQIVLSQRLAVAVEAPPLDLYRALRAINPSPYLFFLDAGDCHLIGSSPEALVTVRGRQVSTRPIAGTRRRGRTADEDESLARELLADAKERAEHIMLVDLGRNDIGRVSRPGSVRVDELMAVEAYSHVLHLVSRVTGELKPELDALHALEAVFPAGTLTGAPKVRAMEWIERLETVRRGPYGGAVGYWAFDGSLDTCIAIRTIVYRDGVAYVQAGAGVVADSTPAGEWQECRQKAMALIEAIRMAEGGLP